MLTAKKVEDIGLGRGMGHWNWRTAARKVSPSVLHVAPEWMVPTKNRGDRSPLVTPGVMRQEQVKQGPGC